MTIVYLLHVLCLFASVSFTQVQAYSEHADSNLTQLDNLTVSEASPLILEKWFNCDITTNASSCATDICVATYVDNDLTVISKLMHFSLNNVLPAGESMKLLNKSVITSRPVSFCDPECKQKFDAGLVYVNNYRLEDLDFFLDYYTPYRCIHPHSAVKNVSYIYYLRSLSLSLMGISILGFIFYIVKFALNKHYRTIPGVCMLAVSIHFLVLYSCFILIKVAPFHVNNRIVCGLYVYFSMASKFWFNVLIIDLWIAVRMATVKLRRHNEKFHIYRFFYYSLYSCGIPLIITLLLMYYPMVENKKERLLKEHCSFIQNSHFFIFSPLIVLQLLNFAFFFACYCMICRSTSRKIIDSKDESLTRGNFLIYFKIASLSLVLWIFGLIGFFAKHEIMSHVYIYTKILEGPLIVWSITTSGKTKTLCRKCFSVCSEQEQTTHL